MSLRLILVGLILAIMVTVVGCGGHPAAPLLPPRLP